MSCVALVVDITYQSLAAAFEQPLEHHAETLRRMGEMIKHRTDLADQTAEQRVARERMALFPARAEVLYIASDIWVVSPLPHVCVLVSGGGYTDGTRTAGSAAGGQGVRVPGDPEALPAHARRARAVPALAPAQRTALPPADLHQVRARAPPLSIDSFSLSLSRIPSRCSLPESSIAPYLTTLQARVKDAGVRVGSYPLLAKGVYVSLIGRDQERIQALSEEVAREIQGRLVSEEEARREKAAL